MKYSESEASASISDHYVIKFFKRNERRLLIVAALLFLIAIPFLIHHFNTKAFELDDTRYRQKAVQGDTTVYQARSHTAIKVRNAASGKEISIGQDGYRISQKPSSGSTEGSVYQVTYPNGNTREAAIVYGHLVDLDSQGEPIWVTISASSTGESTGQSARSAYTPTQLVKAAYPQFHEKAGNPVVFVPLLLLAIFGWCTFRYRQFQDILFQLQGNRLWIRDPEPTEFYYAMSRISGLAILTVALFAAMFHL